jgi:FtsX-like permease family
MLARAATRRQEIGIRAALGANGWALSRQLLIESLLLSVAGAVLGFMVAFWAIRFLVHTMWSEYDPLALSVTPDMRVLFFTPAVAVATGILVGLTPAPRETNESGSCFKARLAQNTWTGKIRKTPCLRSGGSFSCAGFSGQHYLCAAWTICSRLIRVSGATTFY